MEGICRARSDQGPRTTHLPHRSRRPQPVHHGRNDPGRTQLLLRRTRSAGDPPSVVGEDQDCGVVAIILRRSLFCHSATPQPTETTSLPTPPSLPSPLPPIPPSQHPLTYSP